MLLCTLLFAKESAQSLLAIAINLHNGNTFLCNCAQFTKYQSYLNCFAFCGCSFAYSMITLSHVILNKSLLDEAISMLLFLCLVKIYPI